MFRKGDAQERARSGKGLGYEDKTRQPKKTVLEYRKKFMHTCKTSRAELFFSKSSVQDSDTFAAGGACRGHGCSTSDCVGGGEEEGEGHC
jgi:hypothetical protein